MGKSRQLIVVLLVILFCQSAIAGNFVNNGDGTIKDKKQELVWQKKSSMPLTWESAMEYCGKLDLAGKTEWRLPTPKELQSIVKNQKKRPAIDSIIFPGTYPANYWASLTYAKDSDRAWGVDFGLGFLDIFPKDRPAHTRCVIDNQAVEKWSE